MALVKVVSATSRSIKITSSIGDFELDGDGIAEVEQEIAEQLCNPEIYGTTMDGKPNWSMVVSKSTVKSPPPVAEAAKNIIENPADAMKAKLAEKKAAKG